MDQREKPRTGKKKKIPPRAWMSIFSECCVLPGRGLCDELFPRPEESYRVWWVSSVILKPRTMRRHRPPRGCRAIGGGNSATIYTLSSILWFTQGISFKKGMLAIILYILLKVLFNHKDCSYYHYVYKIGTTDVSKVFMLNTCDTWALLVNMFKNVTNT
jgi:hypothetical protein